MENWIANKTDGFNSISKMESYALNHYIYSTSFNNLLQGKFDVKRRRIIMFLLVLNWLLIFLIFSKFIPLFANILPSIGIDFFSLLKKDTNSYIISITAYFTALCYIKTDLFINESSSHLLHDLNLFENGFTNRLNKSNLKKLKIQSQFLYEMLRFLTPLAKLVFTLFYSYYFLMILYDVKDVMKIIISFVLFAYWIIEIYQAFDLCSVYGMIIILAVNYLKIRFDQVNEKMLAIYKNKNKFNMKKLLKIISEHKSIERKTQLYNLRINGSVRCCLIGLTIGLIANLYIVIFSHDNIHQIVSILNGSGILAFEIIIMSEMVALTDSAHKPYAILNSIIVKKKINLKTKLRV